MVLLDFTFATKILGLKNNFMTIFMAYLVIFSRIKMKNREKSEYFFSDMYTGSEKKTSMPIGGLTSQYLANLAPRITFFPSNLFSFLHLKRSSILSSPFPAFKGSTLSFINTFLT